MESELLLPGPGPIVLKQRRHWRKRFVLLSLVGVLALCAQYLLVWKNNYSLRFALHGLKVTPEEAKTQFLSVLEETNYARNWSIKYTHETHLSGSYPLAKWTKDKFEEYGLKASIEKYYVYLNTPKDHALHLLHKDKVVYTAPLKEDELEEDPTLKGDTVPTFHGYSASGNVTAEYFYANYGRKQDYERLVELGVDIKGKIAIVRYGEIYRGLKVKFAEDHGVAAVLMYSDPFDDGEFTPANGYEQYPNGPARHESSVQRGSVMYLSYGPGDPTTPGYPSTKPDVERQDPTNTIPKIPSLPISYREVTPILKQLNGVGLKNLGGDWEGALPGYDYSIGPTVAHKLNLFNDQEYNITTIYNVIGVTEGILADEVIVVGNHRDAWIKGGAGDPNSGSASMLEILRSMAQLKKKGYKPLRTIIWASWDGEEPGLLGLTEWAEEHAKSLGKKVVAYLNVDTSVSGNNLVLELSPLLNDVLLESAKRVPYPKGGSLYEHFINGPLKGKIGILGSGSDYTVFLEYLGIPSVDMGFGSDPAVDPVYQYHSNYDSFYWMDTFCDPGFVYHNILSRFLGVVVLSMADQPTINFKAGTYALEIESYFDDILSQVPPSWNEHGHNRLDFPSAAKLTKKALGSFVEVANHFDAYTAHLRAQLDEATSRWARLKVWAKIQVANWKLLNLDRHFLHEEGLIGRPWFKHTIFASGRYTGYAGQSLPGLREAVEDDDVDNGLRWVEDLLEKVAVVTLLLKL